MKKTVKNTLCSTLSFLLFSATSFAAPPKPPTLSANIDGLNVNLSWTEVEGAAGYTLYYTANPYLGPDFIERVDKSTDTSNSSSLFLGDSYFVAVKAYNTNKEESNYSNIELVTIDQVKKIYLGLSRHQHNNIEIETGTFQLVADVDQKIELSGVQLITPDNTALSNFTIKNFNQVELFIRRDLALMEPALLEGTYRLQGNYQLKSNPGEQLVREITFKVENGNYPAYPEITYPVADAVDVSVNPSITFYSDKPTTIAISKTSNKEEVFFSNDIKYVLESDGAKTVKIDNVTLEPKTEYLLEVNKTDMSIAKGSTSAIAFTTQ